MKPRNREINIFNMSLLDILCGALGAFCFMMLALFPYYKPAHLSAEDRQSYQNAQQTENKLKQLEDALKQQSGAVSQGMMQRIQQALDQARNQLAETQQKLNQTRAAMERAQQHEQQARQQAQQAQQQAQKAHERLAMKHPLLVHTFYSSPATVDLFVHEPGTNVGGQTAPPFNPGQHQQGNFYPSTDVIFGPDGDVWMAGDTNPGRYGVYYRLEKAATVAGSVEIGGAWMLEATFNLMPNITLSSAKPWAKVGDIVLDSNRKATFVPAPGVAASPGQSKM